MQTTMRRHGVLYVLLGCLVLLSSNVQAQTELPVAVDGSRVQQQQQQQQQEQKQQQLERVRAPTIHLRQPGAALPPAPKPHNEHSRQQPAAPGVPRPRVPLLAVITMSACMSFMSCLGVLPYFFVNKLSKPWAGLANAVASGVMLAASFGLLAEGAPYSGTYLIAGMLLGVLFVKFSQEHLEQYEVDSFEQLAGADARKVILFLAVMAVHAVGEGGGVGVSFAGDRGWAQGTLVTLAIGLHNVPEGLAVATVMAAKGTPPGRALLWTALTALPQALVAPPAYVFVDTFRALLPLALGFAAGCMIWIVLAELLPDALEAVEAEQVATYATGAAAWLQGLSVFISHLETPSGTLASPFANYEAVLPLGLLPLLLHLLPACLVPGLLTGLMSKAHWPRPTLLGLSAGLAGSYAAACWLQMLLGSSQRLLCGLVLPAVGAAGAAVLWGWLRKGWQTVAAAGHHQHSSSDDLEDSMCCNGSQKQQWQDEVHGSLPRPPSAAVVVAPAASHIGAATTHLRGSHVGDTADGWEPQHAAAAGQQGKLYHHHHHQQQQQQQHSLAGTPPLAPVVGGASSPTGAVSGAAWDTSSVSSNGSSNGLAAAGLQQQQQQWGVAKQGNSSPAWMHRSSPLPLPGRGDLLLPVTGGHSSSRGDSSWYTAGLGSSSSNSSSRAVAGLMMALGGAVISGLPLGLQLACALAAAPQHMGHVLPPMLLLGVMFGAACLGCLVPLCGPRPGLVATAATLVSSTPVLVAIMTLLCKPGWVQQGAAFAAADRLQGLAVGFNLYVVLLLLLPMGRMLGPRKCSSGIVCGAAGGLVLNGALWLLCLGTPYCMHIHASVLAGTVA